MEALLQGTHLTDRQANCLIRTEKFWNKRSYHVIKINNGNVDAPHSLNQGRRGDAIRDFIFYEIKKLPRDC